MNEEEFSNNFPKEEASSLKKPPSNPLEYKKSAAKEENSQFRLEALSETELSSLRETARQELSGQYYKPEKGKSIKNTVSKDLLARLSSEAISRAKETSQYLKLRDVEILKPKKIENKELPLKEPAHQKEIPPQNVEKIIASGVSQKTNLAEVVKAQNLSLAQIALAEQARKRRMEQMEVISKERSWQRIILSASIILVVLGTGVISYLAFFAEELKNPPRLLENKDYLIVPDSETYIATTGLTNKAVQGRLQETLINLESETNKITNIDLVKKEGPDQKTLSYEEMFTVFEFSPPERLLRSLSSKYMVGTFSGGVNAGFLVLKINSFESGSAGALEWERGTMKNISNLLSIKNITPEKRGAKWKDAFVRNIDTRILIDSTEEIFLIYSFIDKETLVIAPDKDTFLAVVDRYNTPQKVLK
jgi:hypothetical protein